MRLRENDSTKRKQKTKKENGRKENGRKENGRKQNKRKQNKLGIRNIDVEKKCAYYRKDKFALRWVF